MELLERFANGEMDAFETLFRQFQCDVYRWIVRIVRDHGIAEDLTVETFLRIHKAHARFDPSGNFGGWARRIATNLALDHLKRSRREVELPDNLQQPALPDPAVRSETRGQIRRAFRQLSPKLRIVAVLALIEDVPYAEIAASLGISEVAVRVRALRATRILRENLEEQGIEA